MACYAVLLQMKTYWLLKADREISDKDDSQMELALRWRQRWDWHILSDSLWIQLALTFIGHKTNKTCFSPSFKPEIKTLN